jgi:release factor glutamine methyltransferase
VSPTVAEVLQSACREVHAVFSDTPDLDVEVLLAYVLGGNRAWLYAHPEHRLSRDHKNEFDRLLARRLSGVPVAYLVGYKEFFGLDFVVTPDVLIPRPDTEVLVECALELAPRLSSPLIVADVGCGSGAIAVSLAVHLSHTRVVAVDISRPALSVTRQNATRHSVSDRIHCICGDLLTSCAGPFHFILANPPYLRLDQLPSSLPEKAGRSPLAWEPGLALDGGSDGLAVVRRLLAQSSSRLRPGGGLLIEIGAEQGTAARTLALAHFPEAVVDIVPDYAGRDRVLRVIN